MKAIIYGQPQFPSKFFYSDEWIEKDGYVKTFPSYSLVGKLLVMNPNKRINGSKAPNINCPIERMIVMIELDISDYFAQMGRFSRFAIDAHEYYIWEQMSKVIEESEYKYHWLSRPVLNKEKSIETLTWKSKTLPTPIYDFLLPKIHSLVDEFEAKYKK